MAGMMTERQLLRQTFDAVKDAVERNAKPNPELHVVGSVMRAAGRSLPPRNGLLLKAVSLQDPPPHTHAL